MNAPSGDRGPLIPTLTDEELRKAAQGCTELSCPAHGAINAEIRDRRTQQAQETP